MSVTATWDNDEKTAILLTFTAPWTWEAFEQTRDQITAMLHDVNDEIDLIIDVRNGGDIPEDAIRRLRRAYSGAALTLRRYILVGAPKSVQELFGVADRYYTALGGFLEFSFVDTLEEARNLPTLSREQD